MGALPDYSSNHNSPCIFGRAAAHSQARTGRRKGTPVSNSPLAGRPAPAELLIDPQKLEREYYDRCPDVDDSEQLVSFGTSGHRGTPLKGTFTEAHILAISQAICDHRRGKGVDGPLSIG